MDVASTVGVNFHPDLPKLLDLMVLDPTSVLTWDFIETLKSNRYEKVDQNQAN